MNIREQIEQQTEAEKRQFKAFVNHTLAAELARKRRKKVAEEMAKEEVYIKPCQYCDYNHCGECIHRD